MITKNKLIMTEVEANRFAPAIPQRRMAGLAALEAAYHPDDLAPKGRVPDVMELRKNGSLKLRAANN